MAKLPFRIVLVAAFSSLPVRAIFNWNTTRSVLAFGDSYTYVQGTAGRPNYSFIGDAQHFSYDASTLLNDKIVQNQTGTSAGGPNWVEYLTGCFCGSPVDCGKQLWDFAFAGADVSTEYTALHHNFTVPFVDQITQFNDYALPVAKEKGITVGNDDLVIVWIGINDIGDTAKFNFSTTSFKTFPALYEKIISIEFEALETVWEADYVNYLFMNLPPLQLTPLNIHSANPLPSKTMVTEYNKALRDAANTFQQGHRETLVLEFDVYAFLTGIIDDASSYGIKNTTGYCPHYNAPDIATNYASYGCLPIQEYFWYNTGHITYYVHDLLSQAVRKYLLRESMQVGDDFDVKTGSTLGRFVTGY